MVYGVKLQRGGKTRQPPPPAPASLAGFWTQRWPEKHRKPKTCWETRKTSEGPSWEPRRHPASLSAAASDEYEVVSPGPGRVKWLSANPATAGFGRAKAASLNVGESAWSPPGVALWLRQLAPRGALAQPLRAAQNFAHTAANVARLAASPAPRSALGRPSAAAAAGLRLRTFPRCFRFSPRELPRGCGSSAPALRWAGWRCGRCVSDHHLAGPGGVLPRPAPPTPSLPRRSGRAQHLLSPSPPAAEDHTLRLALLTHPPDAAGEGEGSPLLFPGAGRSVWGQGAQEMPRRCVSRTGMLSPSSSAGSSSGGGSGGSGSSSSSSGDCAGSLQATSFIPYTSLPHSPE